MNYSIDGLNHRLRAALVIENETIPGHCDRVRGLKPQFQHTIRCLERPDDGTCVTFALNLLETHRPLVKELQDFRIRPGYDFMLWLMGGNRLTEIPAIQKDALVCYFGEGVWQHVGIATGGGRVTSKWGTYAVFDHKLPELPTNYGNDIQFFARPSARISAGLLFEFACLKLELSQVDADRLRAATGVGKYF